MNFYEPDILKCRQPFIFVVGGRGTGKTFGELNTQKGNIMRNRNTTSETKTYKRFSDEETNMIPDMVSAALAGVK